MERHRKIPTASIRLVMLLVFDPWESSMLLFEPLKRNWLCIYFPFTVYTTIETIEVCVVKNDSGYRAPRLALGYHYFSLPLFTLFYFQGCSKYITFRISSFQGCLLEAPPKVIPQVF